MSKPRGRVRRRILLKVSGSVFSQPELLDSVVSQLITLRRRGVGLAVVPGGGNILRGRDSAAMDRATADLAGMLATVINAIRLTDTLRRRRVRTTHLSAREIAGTVQGYDVENARRQFVDSVLVLSGGTGNPFFSTDSAAALRAVELGCDTLLKGTDVDGVYSADPKQYPGARRYPRLSYEQALNERLRVMDLTAFALCMEHRLPIVVFDLNHPRTIIEIVAGKEIGSRVC